MNAVDVLAASLVSLGDSSSQFAVGTVTAVAAGGAADGNALTSVKWQGATVTGSYLASYTPAVGHVVLMARVGPRLVILGRLIGTPPS